MDTNTSNKIVFNSIFTVEGREALTNMVVDYCGKDGVRRITPSKILEIFVDDADLPLQQYMGSSSEDSEDKPKRQRTEAEARKYLNGIRETAIQAAFMFGSMNHGEMVFNLVGGAKGGVGLANTTGSSDNSSPAAPSALSNRLTEILGNHCKDGVYIPLADLVELTRSDDGVGWDGKASSLAKFQKLVRDTLSADAHLSATYGVAPGANGGVALKTTIEATAKAREDKKSGKAKKDDPAQSQVSSETSATPETPAPIVVPADA